MMGQKKKVSEQATPFYSRLYRKQRGMIKDLMKLDIFPSSADIIRRGIEKVHAEHFPAK